MSGFYNLFSDYKKELQKFINTEINSGVCMPSELVDIIYLK